MWSVQIPLILVGNRIQASALNLSGQSNNHYPRQDYVEVAHRLGGQLSGYGLSKSRYPWARRIETYLKLDVAESFSAVRQLAKYNVVCSTSEKMAIPLAALLQLTGQKIPHIVIGHKLSSGLKRSLWRTWKLHKTFSHLITLCQAQADYALNQLGLPVSAVDFIYDKVDHHFFHPLKVENNGYILAVGQEQRDYQTLAQAVAGTDLKLVIVASSPWSTHQNHISEAQKATVLSHIPYQDLRRLYAEARLVIVPLFDVDYAAGVNSALEAMAMGKALVISHTRGISDYVVPNETGVCVSPTNVPELRDAILSIWEQPEELARLGANARQAVEQSMNLDIYVDQVVQIVGKFTHSVS
jgi:glycosyltransferase involved in cell wall biosynthesis